MTTDPFPEPTAADYLRIAETFARFGLPDLEAASVVLADERLNAAVA